MQMILDALLPVILITALGLGLARINLVTGEHRHSPSGLPLDFKIA